MAHKESDFKLPDSVISPIDLNQVIRALEATDQDLLQAGLRKGGEETKVPRLSRLLNEVAEANKLNLLHAEDRETLTKQLSELKDHAPTMHISFNADPSPIFMQKLTTWVREEIHPHALIRIGLLPTIGAGCVLRTSSKVFDFSLRDRFDKNRQILVDQLKAVAGGSA